MQMSNSKQTLRPHKLLFAREIIKASWNSSSFITSDGVHFEGVRIMGVIVHKEIKQSDIYDNIVINNAPKAISLDDATGVLRINLGDRVRQRRDADLLRVGVLVEVIGTVKMGVYAEKWIECNGFSIKEDPLSEPTFFLHTLHLYQTFYFPSTSIDKTSLRIPPRTPRALHISSDYLQNSIDASPEHMIRHILPLSQNRDLVLTSEDFGDDIDIDYDFMKKQETTSLRDRLSNVIRMHHPPGISIQELRAQFAEVVIACKSEVLEEELAGLMLEGIIYEMSGRYYGL